MTGPNLPILPGETGEQKGRQSRVRVNPKLALFAACLGILLLAIASVGEILRHNGFVMGPCGKDEHGIPWTTWFQTFILVVPQLMNSELAGRLMDKLPSFGGGKT